MKTLSVLLIFMSLFERYFTLFCFWQVLESNNMNEKTSSGKIENDLTCIIDKYFINPL